MATTVRGVLTAATMRTPIFCQGRSRVGIGISGTWVGTVKFKWADDGVNFKDLSATPFPSGTAVSSTTANGSWFTDVLDYTVIQVVLDTYTSGSVVVALDAAIDSSWQNAYLASTSRWVNQASSANTTNTLTIAANANRAWRLRTLLVTVGATATWASSPNFKVTDGASAVLWQGDLGTAVGQYAVTLPTDPGTPGTVGGGVVNTPGNTLVITVPAIGGSGITNINAELSAA